MAEHLGVLGWCLRAATVHFRRQKQPHGWLSGSQNDTCVLGFDHGGVSCSLTSELALENPVSAARSLSPPSHCSAPPGPGPHPHGALTGFQKACLCSKPCLQHPSPKLSDFLFLVSQVCREYQRGNCNRGENDCRFAHPADSAMIDTNDNTVTVCMDYIKGRCSREKCKYFHPPAHLQAKIKAAQYQVNQAAAAQAAATAAAMVSVGTLLDVDVH